MENNQIITCLVNNQVLSCKVIDCNYNSECIEVELLEKFIGAKTIVKKADIKEVIEISGKMDISKFESSDMWEEKKDRTLAFYPSLSTKNGTIKHLNFIFWEIAKYMEDNLDVEFCRCPYDEECNNIMKYGDSFDIEYQHGEMGELKKEIMQVWKEAKKLYKIR